MKTRQFGRTNISVSEIGHGTWTMGGMWGPRDDRAAIDSLVRSLELGVTFIDTAAVYGDGHSEELIASAVKQAKKKPFIATKVPPKNHRWPAKASTPLEEAFPPEHIISQTEQSLRHLRSDCVALQQLHVWADTWMERKDEWFSAVERLKQDGKIRFFGVSINDHEPDSALEIVASGLVDSIQVIYNIFDQSPAEKLFPLCQKHNVAVIVRVPFDEGSLTGSLTPEMAFHKKDWRSIYFTPERLKETCARIERINSLTGPEASTLPLLALKFCLHHPAVSTVIPGMRTIPHVESNCQASDGVSLPSITLARLKNEVWLRNFYPFQ